MSKPPTKKPLFQRPTNKTCINKDTSKVEAVEPLPGQPGWLQTMAKKMCDSEGKNEQDCTPDATVTIGGPKRGEKGWLVELANNLVNRQNDAPTPLISLSQPSIKSDSLAAERSVLSSSQPDISPTNQPIIKFDSEMVSNKSQTSSECSQTSSSFDMLGSLDSALISSQGSLIQEKKFSSLTKPVTSSVNEKSTAISLSQPGLDQSDSDKHTSEQTPTSTNNDIQIEKFERSQLTPASAEIRNLVDASGINLENINIQNSHTQESIINERCKKNILTDNLSIDNIIKKVIAKVNKSHQIGNGNKDECQKAKNNLEKGEIKLKNNSMEKSFSLLDSTIEESSTLNTNDSIKHAHEYGKDSSRNNYQKNDPEFTIENNTKLPKPCLEHSKVTVVEHNFDYTDAAQVSTDVTNNTNFGEIISDLENVSHKQTELEQNDSNLKITGDNGNKVIEVLKTTCDNDDREKDTGSEKGKPPAFATGKRLPTLISKQDKIIQNKQTAYKKIKKVIKNKKVAKQTIGNKKSLCGLVPLHLNKKAQAVKSNPYHKTTQQKLKELQKLRVAGTWVMCGEESCGKWRYLSEKDPSAIPDKWRCSLNSDPSYQSCSDPEEKPANTPQDAWVENRYTVGSLVWAKVPGLPWWPAMVDDDPDTGEFFWTGVKGDIWEMSPSWYHVVFFDSDSHAVTRAWVSSRMIIRYGGRAPGGLSGSYSNRLKAAIDEASEASQIEILERRNQFCFAARYTGVWGKPWPDVNHEKSANRVILKQHDQNITWTSDKADNLMEDDILSTSSSSSLCNESLVADSFNLSLGKVEQAIKKKRKRPNNILHKELYRNIMKSSKKKEGTENPTYSESLIDIGDPKRKLCELYGEKSSNRQEMDFDKTFNIPIENVGNKNEIEFNTTDLETVEEQDKLNVNESSNVKNAVTANDSLNESVINRNIATAMNILDDDDYQDECSDTEVTLTSTPARKLIKLTAVDPNKLVEFSNQEMTSQEKSNGSSKFSSAQLPITPINKVVKLSSESNRYSPRMDGRGDSPFGSLITLKTASVRKSLNKKTHVGEDVDCTMVTSKSVEREAFSIDKSFSNQSIKLPKTPIEKVNKLSTEIDGKGESPSDVKKTQYEEIDAQSNLNKSADSDAFSMDESFSNVSTKIPTPPVGKSLQQFNEINRHSPGIDEINTSPSGNRRIADVKSPTNEKSLERKNDTPPVMNNTADSDAFSMDGSFNM